MHRLVEAYMQLGVYDEARHVASYLGYNYPGTDWYRFSYNILDGAGILEPGSVPPPSKVRGEKKKQKEQEISRPVEIDGAIRPPIGDDIGNNNPVPTDNPISR